MSEKIRTTCNRDCPDSCGIVATVEEGRIVAHKGDPEHGVTRGFLCAKGNRYLDRFYSRDRILHPLRKSGNGWERLSWDEALGLTAEKLSLFHERYGPRSVAFINYSGIKGLVARLMAKKFWSAFGGGTFMKGGTSVEAAHAAQALDLGGSGAHGVEDLAASKGIVIWGKNVAVTRPHCWPFIREARKNGARVIVIDPVACGTARKADRHFALRPGSDAMLAIGVARCLIEGGAIDEGFVGMRSSGFDRYREGVLATSLEDVSGATGLPIDQILELARFYATTSPLATMIGLGPSYWRHGGATVRLIDALVAVTGNIGISGGGAHTDIDGSRGLDLSPFQDCAGGDTREILLPRLGEEILAATDPPLKMGFVAGANPAATCPDTGRVATGLESLEFLVVVDQFRTATAELADLILPCTTYLEMEDLVTAYGHHWIGLNQQVVPPRGEARSDGMIFQELATRLGFGPSLAGEPREWIDRFLAPLREQGITREELACRPRRNPAAVTVPFADGRFSTTSGKFEFIAEIDPPSPDTGTGCLRLMATKTPPMINAQINDRDLPECAVVRANPASLEERGLASGEAVRVESAAGTVRARIEADEDVLRGVLLFNPAAWRGDLQGVNQLRESALCDMGDAAAMHETLVTLRREK
jgi:anaerobic selenocysteine-containing dehydrogenase